MVIDLAAGGAFASPASWTLNQGGNNNALYFAARQTGPQWNGLSVRLVSDGTITSDAATAVYDPVTRTLIIKMKLGVTRANTVIQAVNNDAGAAEFRGNQTGTTHAPGALAASTTYYWRIDSKNSAGTTTGDVWSFTTAAPGTIFLTVTPSKAKGKWIATLDWNLSPAWSITALLPYVNRDHFHIHNHRGERIEERWNLRGVGDMKVLSRWRAAESADPAKPNSWGVTLGVKLPTGEYDQANGAGAVAERMKSLLSENGGRVVTASECFSV